jgi:hypothetical protein
MVKSFSEFSFAALPKAVRFLESLIRTDNALTNSPLLFVTTKPVLPELITSEHDPTSVATTGGTGSGLTVNVVANASGVVTSVAVSSRGSGYLAGDLVTVAGGNVNCKFSVANVQNSNGEIKITEYDNVNFTISGKFKFNAANSNGSPFGGPILNFQYGEFYKIPIYPSI